MSAEFTDINVDVTELDRAGLVVGIQVCRCCGYRGLYVWPAACDVRLQQCASCFEMESVTGVAHAVTDFPDIAARVLSKREFARYNPENARAPYRES